MNLALETVPPSRSLGLDISDSPPVGGSPVVGCSEPRSGGAPVDLRGAATGRQVAVPLPMSESPGVADLYTLPQIDWAAHVEAAPLRWLWLRVGLAALLVLLTAGLLLTAFAMVTNAGPLLRGLAATAMWAGQAAVAVCAHMEGRRSGVYLFGERMSRPVTVFAVGMTVVAIMATIEFSVR